MFFLDTLLERWLWLARGWAPFFLWLAFRFWLGWLRATWLWRRRRAASWFFIIAAFIR
jgi:hypothetical protein